MRPCGRLPVGIAVTISWGRPFADSGFLVGGEVSAREDAQARNRETHLGTSEQPLLVGMPEKRFQAYGNHRNRRASPGICRARSEFPLPRSTMSREAPLSPAPQNKCAAY
jgi:hypothetical protein